MKVTKVFCDAEDCEHEAEFRLTHEMLQKPKHTYDQTVVIDLCGPHAERLALSGRGGVKADFMVMIDRTRADR